MAVEFDHVFVISYGRSGSTLLQGLLNAIPGYRIYGENAGFLTKVHDAYEALLDANRHLSNPANDDQHQAWYGSSRYDQPGVIESVRAFVDGVLFRPQTELSIRVFGFKEIKFNEMGEERLSKYIDFLRNIYPNSAVIFNTRRVDDVLKSGWWRNNFWPGLPKQFTDFAKFSEQYSKHHDDYAIHLRYDALVQTDRREVRRILSFLGEELSDDVIEAVFRGSHSYENRTLTEYLSGRAKHIQLLEPDWWRANIDEFKIDVEVRSNVCVSKGIFLRAVDSDAKIFLRSGDRDVPVVGSIPTPTIGKLHAANPASAGAGFDIEHPQSRELLLFGTSRGFDEALIGIVRPVARAAQAAR